MNEYTHILVAVDLTEESRVLATKASVLQKAYSAKLSCVHVIEPLSLTYGGDVPLDLSTIQEQIQETKNHPRKIQGNSNGIQEHPRQI